MAQLFADWPLFARTTQLPPVGNWRTWLFLGGRGAGKTRAGAEWVRELVCGRGRHFKGDAAGRIALVGETYHDVREIMIEGESGLLAVHPRYERPKWISSRRLLEWPDGTIAQIFSANDPDALRGVQFGAAWCDELAKWKLAEETWNMLQFCMRLGNLPRLMITTTPRPIKLLRKLIEAKDVSITRASSYDNANFVAPGFLDYIAGEYGGTRLGRQEIDGQIIADVEGALWRRALLDEVRIKNRPPLCQIIIAVDPPASSTARSDACGIIAAGKGEDGLYYVLADETVQGAKPEVWAARAVDLYHRLGADCIVAETNQGGDMVQSVLTMADRDIPVRKVHARRGKWLRAEPVAMLYARGKVRHVGSFPELEDQMCNLTIDGLADGASPDRLDALVWAMHALMGNAGEPRVHLI